MPTPHTDAVRALWGLDYTQIIVNHGSYGATPLEVLARQLDWQRQMETYPTRFMVNVLPGALRTAAAAVGAAIGARGEDVALVDNATGAVNAILASLEFQPGDEILVHSHLYGALLNASRHIASRTGAVIVTAELPFPNATRDGIISAFTSKLSPRTRLVIADHVTSASALVFPLAEIVAACHAADAQVIIDGAHGPGQVPVDVNVIGADYYVGNGHKWWMGAKGAGFLWAAPERQATLHPNIISWGYGSGFTAEFDWTGTRDWSAALVLPDAIAFHERLGGRALMAANADLARTAAARLSARFGTALPNDPDLHASMTLVQLPNAGEATSERALALRTEFLALGCDVPVTPIGDHIWLRLSAQAYNLPSDYDRLGDLIDQIWQKRR